MPEIGTGRGSTWGIHVKREHIDGSVERDSQRCMIADAITAAHPHWQRVLVDLQTIRWTNPRTRKRYIALTPPKVADALVEFDRGIKSEPFHFSIKVIQERTLAERVRKTPEQLAAQGRSGQKKGSGLYRTVPGGTEKVTTFLPGGEKVVTSSTRQQVPTGHLSNSRVRERKQATGDEGNIALSRNDLRSFGRRLLKQ